MPLRSQSMMHAQNFTSIFWMGLLLLLCLAVFVYDVSVRRVPNRLLLAALAIHAGGMLYTGHGIGGISAADAMTGGLIGLALFVPLYAFRAMGAGDVKFFAVLGVLLGPAALIPVWLIASLLAGMHAIVWYLQRRQVLTLLPRLGQVAQQVTYSAFYQRLIERRNGRAGIPYAAYLALAAVMVSSWQHW